jgi:exo-beta-1,3-glucanase (GH17 family)
MKPTDIDISMSKIQLTAKQKNDFNSQLKIAVYNQLFKNGFISSAQLDTLIARVRSSAKAADYGRN